MILSHKHKFIYFKTLKTGSSAIEILLSLFFKNENDIITRIDPESDNIRKKLGISHLNDSIVKKNEIEFKNLFHNFKQFIKYIPYLEYIYSYKDPTNFKNIFKEDIIYYSHYPAIKFKRLYPKIFEEYYKITSVRNPYDQIISYYFFKKRNKKNFYDFKSFLEKYSSRFFKRNLYIFTYRKEIIVDKILYYENLENDLLFLKDKLKLDKDLHKLIKDFRVKTNFKKKNNFLDDEANLKIINNSANELFELLNYEKRLSHN